MARNVSDKICICSHINLLCSNIMQRKLYVFHQSDKRYFKHLLQSGELLPSSKTKFVSQTPVSVNLPYIFFSCCYKRDFPVLHAYTIVYDVDILYNKTFYTNLYHSYGDTSTAKKISHTATPNAIAKHLHTLLKNSRQHRQFMVFQEIFMRGKLPLSFAKYIVVEPSTPKTIILYINKKYPHIEILYTY